MVLKPQDKSFLDIASQDIWQDDILQRKETAWSFIKIIGCCQEAITMCLNAGWGTGKTFFLTRLCEQYRRAKDPVDGKEVGGRAIYFNAWEDDDLDDPLIAIVGQIWHNLKGGTLEECVASITSCAPKLLGKFAVKLGLGMLKSVPVAGEALKDAVEKAVEGIAGDAGPKDLFSATENVFTQYDELTESKLELKKRLEELGEKVYMETKRPLLFVIDELDRCRPSFAIETLERVKHLFGVPHIVFLFGVDCEQLKKSVCSVYGDVDAENYLNRFFDVEMSLPQGNNEQFFRMLHSSHELPDKSSYTCQLPYLLETLMPLSEVHSLSLRELEKIDRTMALIAATNLAADAEKTVLLPVLAVLKMRNQEVYEKVIKDECEYAELIDALYCKVHQDDLFRRCASTISTITTWYTQDSPNDAPSATLRESLLRIVNTESFEGLDMSTLPETFQNAPFSQLKNCLTLALSAHGYRQVKKSLPIVANALNCIRYG